MLYILMLQNFSGKLKINNVSWLSSYEGALFHTMYNVVFLGVVGKIFVDTILKNCFAKARLIRDVTTKKNFDWNEL